MRIDFRKYTQMTGNCMTDANEAFINANSKRAFRGIPFLLNAVGGSLLLVSCATSTLPLVTVTDANTEYTGGYRIADGDKLKVIVFDEPTLSGDFGVGLDGGISLPLINSMRAAGQTPNELAENINTALSAGGYVLAPRVSVEVSQHRPFYILGEVKAPGEYPYVGDLTVEQAIAKAQGYSARANRSEVVLRRQGSNAARRVRLDTVPLLIAPGDTITVQEAFF